MEQYNECGVIYLAIGSRATSETRWSILSLRRSGNKHPVAVVTDQPDYFTQDDVQFVTPVKCGDGAFDSRAIKTRLHRYTPFDVSLYLDSDTLVLGSLDEAFLGNWERLAVSQDWHHTVGDFKANPLNQHAISENTDAIRRYGPMLPFWNAGVMRFNRRSQAELFELWFKEWSKWKRTDQHALACAIQHTPYASGSIDKLRPHMNATHFRCGRLGPQIRSVQEARLAGVKVWHLTPMHIYTGKGDKGREAIYQEYQDIT